MRFLRHSLIIFACFLSQKPPAAKLFPIPENMDYEFPGVKLTTTDAKLLRRAFEADFRKADWGERQPPEKLAMTSISLGKLGYGLILKVNDNVVCGTGGCPLYVYVRKKGAWRSVAQSFGWAFGIVPSESDVPDLAFASSAGGGLMTLSLQHYNGHVFMDYACEMLTAKKGFPRTQDDWWDLDKVSVSPCENSVSSSPGVPH